eukprot:3033966-Rhodomonas_salina.2
MCLIVVLCGCGGLIIGACAFWWSYASVVVVVCKCVVSTRERCAVSGGSVMSEDASAVRCRKPTEATRLLLAGEGGQEAAARAWGGGGGRGGGQGREEDGGCDGEGGGQVSRGSARSRAVADAASAGSHEVLVDACVRRRGRLECLPRWHRASGFS